MMKIKFFKIFYQIILQQTILAIPFNQIENDEYNFTITYDNLSQLQIRASNILGIN